jgi:superfamily II DNA/RNA helicase
MDVDVVAKSLKSHGFDAAPIHGDLDQSMRTRTLEQFRDGKLQLLIASDVAARGLDVPSVSHVFNFDMPSHPEDYVHRIGRTGRAGRLGKAYSICVPSDAKYLAAIESLVKQEIPRGEVPEGALEGLSDRPDRPRDETRGPRSRDRNTDKRERPVKPHTEMASLEPVAAQPVIEVAVMAEPEQSNASRPERSRDRGEDRRRDDRRRDDRPREDRPREDRPRDDRARDERPREDRPRDDRPREERPRDDRRDPRRDDRRERAPREDHNRVIGMGDHVPDFILRSFALKPQSAEDIAAEAQAEDLRETTAEA